MNGDPHEGGLVLAMAAIALALGAGWPGGSGVRRLRRPSGRPSPPPWRKNDRGALAKLTALDAGVNDGPGAPKTLDQYFAKFLTPKVRTCLAAAKPVRDAHDGAVTYAAFCGQLIYTFETRAGAWRFTGIGADD